VLILPEKADAQHEGNEEDERKRSRGGAKSVLHVVMGEALWLATRKFDAASGILGTARLKLQYFFYRYDWGGGFY